MAGQEYHCPRCESSPCRKLSDICARSFIASCEAALWLAVIWSHSCGSNGKVFEDCLGCQGVAFCFAHIESAQRYKKSLSPTKCGKRLLQTDSLCAIISKGIQVSRVPFQVCYICQGLRLPTDCHPEEEAVGLILLHRFIISLLVLYCKSFFCKIETYFCIRALAFQCFLFYLGKEHCLLPEMIDARLNIFFQGEFRPVVAEEFGYRGDISSLFDHSGCKGVAQHMWSYVPKPCCF